MPRKTKEQSELNNKDLEKATKKTSTTKKSEITKKSVAKKTSTSTTKKANSTTKKTTAQKTASKKNTSTKPASTSKKSKVNEKTTTKKASATKKTSTKKTSKKVEIVEYYDLPENYKETTIKLLAQTPNSLFVYWNISNEDKNKYIQNYGNDFFNTTIPILIIHNSTMGYNFEVEVNDFANSWYLKVQDSKCDYKIELARKFKNVPNTNYVHIYTSNILENPNDKILFNIDQKMVYFRNVKDNSTISKDISSLTHIKNMGKIYNTYDMYKSLYNKENLEDIYNLQNPSSAGSQSFIKGD